MISNFEKKPRNIINNKQYNNNIEKSKQYVNIGIKQNEMTKYFYTDTIFRQR